MKCFVGIDLGSTTTKTVVLGEDGAVLGRGITNSRSNYDVACAVARSEALVDTRFHLFQNALRESPDLDSHAAWFLDAVRRAFRLEQHQRLLDELEETCRVHAESLGAVAPSVLACLAGMFEDLREEAAGLFASGAPARSDFFRDLAGSRFTALAEAHGKRRGVRPDLLIGLYDKSIIPVENRPPEGDLQDLLGKAVETALDGCTMSERWRDEIAWTAQRAAGISLVEVRTVGTGYGRARLPFPKEQIRSEILCHGLGAHAVFPGTRTVLDIGGQDTKAIQVDERGLVKSFQMNDRCAAGCGRYLGYIADEMNLGLHELGPMAMQGKHPVRINSTCTVFAGAELRDRLTMGQKREDILAGLHRAIILRAMSLLARSGGVFEQFTFTGGVARNEAAVRALRELVAENYGERTINISPDSIYTGAFGAALFALREERGEELAQPRVAPGEEEAA